MNRYQNISLKQLFSIALLALLFLVQGSKLFHNHTCFGKTQDSPVAFAAQEAIMHGHAVLEEDITRCAVCEFHFLKDISEKVSGTVLAVPVSDPVFFAVPPCPAVSPELPVTSLRGPPIA